MNVHLITMLVYVVGLIWVGAWIARRVRTSDDFMIAGRRLGLPVHADGRAAFAIAEGVAVIRLPSALAPVVRVVAVALPRTAGPYDAPGYYGGRLPRRWTRRYGCGAFGGSPRRSPGSRH